jgi:hypothetical protein
MVHNILDYQGNVVGQLELPDNTPADVVAAKLAPYAKAPAPEVIEDVTPRQIRQALILSGYSLAMIDSAISQLPEPTQSLARVEWEYSTMVQRNRPLVSQMAALLGVSSAQLDALFKLAKTL